MGGISKYARAIACATLAITAIVLLSSPTVNALTSSQCPVTTTATTSAMTTTGIDVPLTLTNNSTEYIKSIRFTIDSTQYTVSGTPVQTGYGWQYVNNVTNQYQFNNSGGYPEINPSDTKTFTVHINAVSATSSSSNITTQISYYPNGFQVNPANCDTTVTLATAPQTLPAPTISGTAGTSENSLNITSGGGNVDNWYIYRDGTKIGETGGSSSYSDTTPVNGTEYSYTARSVSGTIVSPDSNAVLLTSTAPPTGGGGTTATDITPRDIQLIGLGTAVLIGYKFIGFFRYRGNE